VKLVDTVRRNGEPITEELSLSRGPFGEAVIHLSVRVARLGARYILLLAEDRTELNDLADAMPERAEAMLQAWDAWAERVGARKPA
ncbi:MAG TPA: hypothetical protein PLD73_19060, partial [Candidatus Hydrogenedentes bacterium]|nr:hypothetical protein [Candidatus Hydrogenedentota bacterium]